MNVVIAVLLEAFSKASGNAEESGEDLDYGDRVLKDPFVRLLKKLQSCTDREELEGELDLIWSQIIKGGQVTSFSTDDQELLVKVHSCAFSCAPLNLWRLVFAFIRDFSDCTMVNVYLV